MDNLTYLGEEADLYLRAFEKYLQENRFIGNREALRDLCSGWYARYEVWSVKDPIKRLLDLQIPLDRRQVWLQLRHSGHDTSLHGWKMQFPIAIAPNGRTFAILRQIFHFKSTEQDTTVKLSTSALPLDLTSALQRKWSHEYTPADGITRDLYLYQILFNRDGSRVFFIDQIGLLHNLAAYTVDWGNVTPVVLRGSLVTNEMPFLDLRTAGFVCKASFHPGRDLLGISLGGQAFLWDYRASKLPLQMIDNESVITGIKD